MRVGIKWSQRKAVLGRGVMTGQLQLLGARQAIVVRRDYRHIPRAVMHDPIHQHLNQHAGLAYTTGANKTVTAITTITPATLTETATALLYCRGLTADAAALAY